MTTIITRTLPATDTKPARVLAKFGDAGWGRKTATVAFDHGYGYNENHLTAARKLWALWAGDLDADYVGAGDVAARGERVHLLKEYPGDGGFVVLPVDAP